MEELFTKRIEDYIESTNMEISTKINSHDCFSILNDCENYVNGLIDEYSVEIFEVDFDKIKWDKHPNSGIDRYGNPIELYKYTFKVPFKGNTKLLDYRPNKGLYRQNTYFIENNYIVFQSLNFDLEPTPLKFYNSIRTLKSIISNLIAFYEEWNDELCGKIEGAVKYRENILIEYHNFCKKYGISKEDSEKMKFKLAALEALSKIIANNNTGFEITILFKKAGFPEIVHDDGTKWRFVCSTFEEMQEESIEGFYKILKVLEVVCDPQEYLSCPNDYEPVLKDVNNVLGFYGFEFNDEGTLIKLDKVNTKLKTPNKIKDNSEEHFDVFISHSSSDKPWVNELYECLSKTDLKIWYDIDILQIGDNLREKINEGLIKSNYGVVVLSKDFIERSWPKMEFDALYPLMDEGKLLPINHGLSDEELSQFFKPLSNIKHVSSDKASVKQICMEIYSKIKGM